MTTLAGARPLALEPTDRLTKERLAQLFEESFKSNGSAGSPSPNRTSLVPKQAEKYSRQSLSVPSWCLRKLASC